MLTCGCSGVGIVVTPSPPTTVVTTAPVGGIGSESSTSGRDMVAGVTPSPVTGAAGSTPSPALGTSTTPAPVSVTRDFAGAASLFSARFGTLQY